MESSGVGGAQQCEEVAYGLTFINLPLAAYKQYNLYITPIISLSGWMMEKQSHPPLISHLLT